MRCERNEPVSRDDAYNHVGTRIDGGPPFQGGRGVRPERADLHVCLWKCVVIAAIACACCNRTPRAEPAVVRAAPTAATPPPRPPPASGGRPPPRRRHRPVDRCRTAITTRTTAAS